MATEMLKRVNSSDDEEAVRDKTVTQQYRFQPKTGSVIPAKRRLVKTLMYESIVQSVASLFCSRGCVASSSSSKNRTIDSKITVPPNSSANGRKDNNIFPNPSQDACQCLIIPCNIYCLPSCLCQVLKEMTQLALASQLLVLSLVIVVLYLSFFLSSSTADDVIPSPQT